MGFVRSYSLYCIKSLHIIHNWIELGTITQCLTVAILLSLSISLIQLTVRVLEHGNTLIFVGKLPDALVDLKHCFRIACCRNHLTVLNVSSRVDWI